MDNIAPDDRPTRIYASDTKAFFHKFYRTEGIDHRSTVNKNNRTIFTFHSLQYYFTFYFYLFYTIYLSIARMLVAITSLFAFRFAQILFRAWQLFGMLSAATFFLDDFKAGPTVASMAAFRTNMIATFECFLASITARANIFCARRLRFLFTARTRSRQSEWTGATLSMAFRLAFVSAAIERFVTHFVAVPNQTVAIPFLLTIAANAILFTFLCAWRAFVWFVTGLATHMNSARQHLRALKS